jgi:hypothetical protein
LTWVSQNTALIEDIRAYAGCFKDVRPLVFQCFEGGTHPVLPYRLLSEEGFKMLLIYASLFQDVTEKQLVGFLRRLYECFGSRLFTLNTVLFDELSAVVDKAVGFEWPLRTKVPGILRSCADFFTMHGGIRRLINVSRGSEALVDLVSKGIFFMGKSSGMKFKARTFARLAVLADTSLAASFWSETSVLPFSKGANRLIYYIGPLRDGRKKMAGDLKLDYFNRFYNLLFPGESWRLYEAFDAYQKREKINEFKCQQILSGCNRCVLNRHCWPNK